MTTKPGHRTVAEGPGGTLFRGLRLEFTSASAGIAILGVADRHCIDGPSARVVVAVDGAEAWMTPNAARRLVLYIEAAIASAELEGRRA